MLAWYLCQWIIFQLLFVFFDLFLLKWGFSGGFLWLRVCAPSALGFNIAIEGEDKFFLATLISTMELLQGIGSEPCAVRGG